MLTAAWFDQAAPRNLLMERELLAQERVRSDRRIEVPGCNGVLDVRAAEPAPQPAGSGELQRATTGNDQENYGRIERIALAETPAAGTGLATGPVAAEVAVADPLEPTAWERDHAEARRLRRKARRQRKKERRQARAHAG